jgi:hypothetical protein
VERYVVLAATIAVEVTTAAAPSLVWDAIRDIGALHTRPSFP